MRKASATAICLGKNLPYGVLGVTCIDIASLDVQRDALFTRMASEVLDVWWNLTRPISSAIEKQNVFAGVLLYVSNEGPKPFGRGRLNWNLPIDVQFVCWPEHVEQPAKPATMCLTWLRLRLLL